MFSTRVWHLGTTILVSKCCVYKEVYSTNVPRGLARGPRVLYWTSEVTLRCAKQTACQGSLLLHLITSPPPVHGLCNCTERSVTRERTSQFRPWPSDRIVSFSREGRGAGVSQIFQMTDSSVLYFDFIWNLRVG